jgi:divalent metal cation (Fe/Co/Zn/Cd) transporter
VASAAKLPAGLALRTPVLLTEGGVTFIDGLLAVAVVLGLALDLAFGWWWADPMVGSVIV